MPQQVTSLDLLKVDDKSLRWHKQTGAPEEADLEVAKVDNDLYIVRKSTEPNGPFLTFDHEECDNFAKDINFLTGKD